MAKFNPGDRVRYTGSFVGTGTVCIPDHHDIVRYSYPVVYVLWDIWPDKGALSAEEDACTLVEDPFDTWVKRVREDKDAEV